MGRIIFFRIHSRYSKKRVISIIYARIFSVGKFRTPGKNLIPRIAGIKKIKFPTPHPHP